LQRQCIEIARRLAQRGHKVTIFCVTSDVSPDAIPVVTLPVRAFSNHARNLAFADAVSKAVAGKFDVVVGFNKMPFLDLLYCADPPIPKPAWRYLSPRIRGYERLDRTCFAGNSTTRLLLLASFQKQQYIDHYGTAADRIVVLPPTLERARILTPDERVKARVEVRKRLALGNDALVWLLLGRYPKSKGLDRVIRALMAAPEARCVCAGFDRSAFRNSGLERLARRHMVLQRLILLGRCDDDDIPRLIAAADVLVHPSRKDVTGTVILEAIGNGLPVITSEVCGYSTHVQLSGAGAVVREPFDETQFRAALEAAKSPAVLSGWRQRALAYSAHADLYSGLDKAVEEIEQVALQKKRSTVSAIS
jgi:UDP-glucose:(heptosyl)LPS alpha-1,3-glucosyltransferase